MLTTCLAAAGSATVIAALIATAGGVFAVVMGEKGLKKAKQASDDKVHGLEGTISALKADILVLQARILALESGSEALRAATRHFDEF